MYCVYQIQAAASYSSLYFFTFVSSFQTYKIFRHFSQELWGLEDWNLVHMWTVGRCIVCTGIRLLLLIRAFIFHFYFSPIFKHKKKIVTLCSGTVRPKRLKLVTHMASGWMYYVYPTHTAALIHPFILSFFFLSNFQSLKKFLSLFSGTVRPRRLKLGNTWGHWEMYPVYQNQAAICPLILLFFFPIFKHENFSSLFSGTVRHRRLKLGIHVDGGQMYRVYQNRAAAAAYLSLYFFIFLSLQFSNIKILSHFSQELCGLESWNLIHPWTVGRCIVYTGIRLLLLIHSFIFNVSVSPIFKH